MEWVELVTPALAVIGVLLGVGLLVQSIRQARAIRRLEERLADAGVAAGEAPLQRLQELQQRLSTSQGEGRRSGRTPLIAAAAIISVAVIGVGAWAMFLRGGDPGEPAAAPGQTTTSAAAPGGTTTAQAPADPTLCRGTRPLDADTLAVTTVSIFNASGIEGAARLNVQPAIDTKGYTVDLVANPPDGRSDLQTTVVQFVTPEDRAAACNVARDLGLRPARATPLEGFSADQVGGDDVNVVVLVGVDLANG